MGETPTTCDDRGRSTMTLNLHTCFHRIFDKIKATQGRVSKWSYTIVDCAYISYVHVRMTEGRFVFNANKQGMQYTADMLYE